MIRIITDSTCDIPRSQWHELDIDVISLTINFGAHVYRDGRDLDHAEFYDMLVKAEKLPTTSQASLGEFEELFRKYTENGDEVVGIFMASTLSGTVQSAKIAAASVGSENIHIVDSRTISFGMGMLVRQAIKMRDSGKYSAAEIAEEIHKLTTRVRIFAVIESLKYLKMGGRISSGAAIVGGLLGIMPLIEVYDGSVNAIAKARGDKMGIKMLGQMKEQYTPDFSYGFCFGHACCEDRMNEYIDAIRPSLPIADEDIFFGTLGCIIGTHAGPGIIGLCFIEKE